jgi:Flp pilus assembly protein TadD
MALAKIGFFLCREGLVAEAEGVFRGLAESAPERDGPAAGIALCLIIKGDSESAVKLLDRHLAKGDKCVISGQLNLYKLLALGMAGRIRDAENLRGEMDRKGFAEIARKADAILDDLKKAKTP